MISKNIKHYLVAGCVCCGIATAFTACADWNDHYGDSATESNGGVTLWQRMQSEAQLSDFCKVLEETKVFRMHKKTVVSYADLLNSGQSFTVVAPVNGSFNCDSLLQLVQTNQGDSLVEKFFILNHLSRSTTSVKDFDQSMRMLNSKNVVLGGTTIQGVTAIDFNKHSHNGVLHIVSKPLPYLHSLYESLCDLQEMSAIGSLLRLYDEDYFDADASVSSGIVEGVPVYVDSVIIERNRLLQQIGLINAEDSTYWVVAPSSAGWQKAYSEAEKYFTYDKQVLKRDSLQQYWTMRALLDDAIFNMTDQKSEDATQDSIVSVPYMQWRKTYVAGKPKLHVFNNPFKAGGIFDGAKKISCSNGLLYQVDEWPFTPEQTYFQQLWSEGENTALITDYKDCTYNVRREVADSISDNAYLQIVPGSSTSNWTMTFRVNNTLAGNYDFGVVVLPKRVSDQIAPDTRACKFRATITYVDADGKEQSFNCNKTTFETDPTKVDTVWIAPDFNLPACNYDQKDIKVTVKLQCYISAKETSSYAREMYLDCIYLRPRTSKAE